jgi:hypothetical protein
MPAKAKIVKPPIRKDSSSSSFTEVKPTSKKIISNREKSPKVVSAAKKNISPSSSSVKEEVKKAVKPKPVVSPSLSEEEVKKAVKPKPVVSPSLSEEEVKKPTTPKKAVKPKPPTKRVVSVSSNPAAKSKPVTKKLISPSTEEVKKPTLSVKSKPKPIVVSTSEKEEKPTSSVKSKPKPIILTSSEKEKKPTPLVKSKPIVVSPSTSSVEKPTSSVKSKPIVVTSSEKEVKEPSSTKSKKEKIVGVESSSSSSDDVPIKKAVVTPSPEINIRTINKPARLVVPEVGKKKSPKPLGNDVIVYFVQDEKDLIKDTTAEGFIITPEQSKNLFDNSTTQVERNSSYSDESVRDFYRFYLGINLEEFTESRILMLVYYGINEHPNSMSIIKEKALTQPKSDKYYWAYISTSDLIHNVLEIELYRRLVNKDLSLEENNRIVYSQTDDYTLPLGKDRPVVEDDYRIFPINFNYLPSYIKRNFPNITQAIAIGAGDVVNNSLNYSSEVIQLCKNIWETGGLIVGGFPNSIYNPVYYMELLEGELEQGSAESIDFVRKFHLDEVLEVPSHLKRDFFISKEGNLYRLHFNEAPDIDVFIHNTNYLNTVKDLLIVLTDTYPDYKLSVSQNALTFDLGYNYPKVQIIKRAYNNGDEIFAGFDIDPSRVMLLFNASIPAIIAPEIYYQSVKYGINMMVPSRQSESFNYRAAKYYNKGFEPSFPFEVKELELENFVRATSSELIAMKNKHYFYQMKNRSDYEDYNIEGMELRQQKNKDNVAINRILADEGKNMTEIQLDIDERIITPTMRYLFWLFRNVKLTNEDSDFIKEILPLGWIVNQPGTQITSSFNPTNADYYGNIYIPTSQVDIPVSITLYREIKSKIISIKRRNWISLSPKDETPKRSIISPGAKIDMDTSTSD